MQWPFARLVIFIADTPSYIGAIPTAERAHGVLTAPSSALLGATLLRLGLGLMFLAHALLKLLVFMLPGTAQFFASQGLPGGLAYLVFAAELLGGLALLLGWYARQVALLLSPILVGALGVHWPNGWLFTAQGGGWEYPAFLLLASLALWLVGDGAWALRRSSAWVPGARS